MGSDIHFHLLLDASIISRHDHDDAIWNSVNRDQLFVCLFSGVQHIRPFKAGSARSNLTCMVCGENHKIRTEYIETNTHSAIK